ncbi:hypothetical protein ASJ81_05655 [Methanosarcina spelaei]|uniref:Uncharacterized protein n=1 Tax=Methanosarcina spelaei TaxID=1036679 RepID=A0A2A2HTT2_9EURY|nr:halocin C8-like domain-containing protein [Methanosarcina spelaei]PAV12690.1 hypothetical protein ASJ81_05655 [Methanosarcina spelaei]
MQKSLDFGTESKGYELNKTDYLGLGAIQADGSYIEGLALSFESPDDSSAGIYVVFKNNEIIKAEAKILRADKDKLTAEVLTVKGNNIVTESGNISSVMAMKSSAAIDAVTTSSTGCEACQALVYLACKHGCGKGGQLLCAMADLSIVGGIACTLAVYAICNTIGTYGCGHTSVYLCQKAKFC